MPKYYRVRSQQEWDWLADKLNIYCVKSMACPVIIEHEQGQKDYRIVQYYGGFEPVIEVSQMMEESKMEDYVTIKDEDLLKIKNEDNRQSFYAYIDDLFIPANYFKELHIPKSLVQPKVKMTQAEKKEFDKLKDEMSLGRHDLDDLLTRIKDSEDFPFLYHRLYVADGNGVEIQLEFARAWADPSLIETIPDKKWNVKVPASDYKEYYQKSSTEKIGTISFVEKHTLKQNNMQFTAEELKQYGLDNDLFEKVEVEE